MSIWLDQIPDHWVKDRLGWASRIRSGGTPDTDDESMWADAADEDALPWIAIGDMSRTYEVKSTTKRVTQLGIDSKRLPIGEVGTILLAMYASVGEVSRLGFDATWNQALLGIEPLADRLDPRFLTYVLVAAREELLSDVRSNTQSNLNASQVAALRVPRPPLPEQRAIADFLDRETAQIDALIEKQERLIATLRERGDAAWAERYESLAENVGLTPVRRVIESIVDGPFGSSLTSSHYSDDGVRVIRLGNIGINEFRTQDEAFISVEHGKALAAHSAVAGDVVVAGLGDERMPLGRAAVVPEIGSAIVKADCFRIRTNNLVTPAFLAWAMSSPPARSQIRLLSRGATRSRLNTNIVRMVEVPVPPLDDQESAMRSSRHEQHWIANLVSRAERFIELSRERRAALITAAVTGQINITRGKV